MELPRALLFIIVLPIKPYMAMLYSINAINPNRLLLWQPKVVVWLEGHQLLWHELCTSHCTVLAATSSAASRAYECHFSTWQPACILPLTELASRTAMHLHCNGCVLAAGAAGPPDSYNRSSGHVELVWAMCAAVT
jgi:hypothetical protein